MQFLITLLAVVAVPAGLLTFMRRSRTWSFGPADGPLPLLLLLSTLAAPIAGAQDDNPVLVGVVTRVTDGDTIRVELSSGPITVRFDSIDTPESNQPWGKEATEALRRRVLGQEVALDVASQDRYERLIAVVYLGEENLNEWMVKQGHAWVYRQYARDRSYCAWEHAARTARRGLWSLPPDQRVAPWEWRQSRRGRLQFFTDYSNETAEACIAALGRRPAAPAQRAASSNAAPRDAPTATAPSGRCLIKGNISSSGRIYHLPGSPNYDRTVIDESKDERWFCSEDEARAAGWRPPKGR